MLKQWPWMQDFEFRELDKILNYCPHGHHGVWEFEKSFAIKFPACTIADCKEAHRLKHYNHLWSTRESTPCSLIRNSDTARTPGSTTRRSSSIANNQRVRNDTQRIPHLIWTGSLPKLLYLLYGCRLGFCLC